MGSSPGQDEDSSTRRAASPGIAQTGHGIHGNPPRMIYELAAQSNSWTLLRSVDNVTSGSVPYDSQTGSGTPNAWNLAQAIAALGSL